MPSPFASLTVSDPIPLPFDEGQWIKVRKLTGKEYEAVQVAHRLDFVRGERWAGLFLESVKDGVSSAAVQRALADPLTGHDRYELVRLGLVAWSYPQSLKPIAAVAATEGAPAVEAQDAIGDLDDDAVEFIAYEVLKLTKPGLFIVSADDGKAAQVKG